MNRWVDGMDTINITYRTVFLFVPSLTESKVSELFPLYMCCCSAIFTLEESEAFHIIFTFDG